MKTTPRLIIGSSGEVQNAWRPKGSQVRFCTVSLRKHLHGILQACSACAPSWAEISLGLISSRSVLTSLTHITPDWPGMWVKWPCLCSHNNARCALGERSPRWQPRGDYCCLSKYKPKEHCFTPFPNHSSFGKWKGGSWPTCGCPLTERWLAGRLKISL